MAGSEGFEPSIRSLAYSLSRGAPSAARPLLQKLAYYPQLLARSQPIYLVLTQMHRGAL